MQIAAFTQKGDGALNEDALISNPEANLYGVLDGVSSLVPYVNANKETGGFIASNLVKSVFESLAKAEDLKQHTLAANRLLQERMNEANIDPVKKDELWGTALAIVRFLDDGVEYIQTGDCMILAVYEDGEVRPLTRRQVAHLEADALKIWQEGIARGLNRRTELYATVINTIRKNRYMSNAAGGYGVLNGEADAGRFLEYGKINLTGLTHLIMLTDGMFWPPEPVPVEVPYWTYVAQSLISKGTEAYVKELTELEESDPECIRYARFKKSDDKTAAIIRF